jgi:hypothetical protein
MKRHIVDFFFSKCFLFLCIHFPYIGEEEDETRTSALVDLDTPIVIFDANLSRGRNQEGG